MPSPGQPRDDPCWDGASKAGRAPGAPWLFFSQNRVHSLELRALLRPAWTAAPSAQRGVWGDASPVGGAQSPGHASISAALVLTPFALSASVSSLCSPGIPFSIGASALGLLGPAWCWAGGQRVQGALGRCWAGRSQGDGRSVEAHVPVAWRCPQAGTRASGAQSQPEPIGPRGFLDKA